MIRGQPRHHIAVWPAQCHRGILAPSHNRQTKTSEGTLKATSPLVLIVITLNGFQPYPWGLGDGYHSQCLPALTTPRLRVYVIRTIRPHASCVARSVCSARGSRADLLVSESPVKNRDPESASRFEDSKF